MSSLERLEAPRAKADTPSAPLRGRRYVEDRLHLLIRDPRRAVAIWEISPALHARAESLAFAAGGPLRYRLLVHEAPRADDPPARTATIDLPDALRDESWYVELSGVAGFAQAELGLDLASGFAPLLRSRWMAVAPEGPCAETGTWPVDPARAAWLEAEAARARGGSPRPLPSSAARYLAPPGTDAP